MDGLRKTIDWYFAIKDQEKVKEQLDHRLTER